MVVGTSNEQKGNRLSAEIKTYLEADMNMNEPNQPMNFNPGPTPTPTPGKKNNTTLIIVIVVVIILCCCCVAGGAAWRYGDEILKAIQNATGTGALIQML